MTRFLATLIAPALAALIAAPAFAEAQPQTIPIQFTPPKSNVTVRTVTLDTAGAVTPEGQKVLDDMIEEGWRAMGITTVSAEQPVKIAVMFTRIVRPSPQPGQVPMPPQPGIQARPPLQAPAVRPLPPPAGPPPPANDHNP